MRTSLLVALALLPLVACRSKADTGVDSVTIPGDSAINVDSHFDDTGSGDSAVPVDADGDGYTSVASGGDDCDDTNPAVFPGAAEVCDGIDNDCDGLIDDADPNVSATTTWYADADGDGYGDDATGVEACTQPSGTVGLGGDCNDADPAYNPGATESDCTDPNDYNCDGSVGYADADGDGFPACQDCNDADGTINPNAAEVCDGSDNDCDGLVDDADPGITGQGSWYTDADGDGYGADSPVTLACTQPAGTSALAGDCDDTDPAYNPGASETDCTDPHDYNCDGSTGYADADADGFAACQDCDDTNAAVNPLATEICDGIDNNCDGTVDEATASDATVWYADTDHDGYGGTTSTTACDPLYGYVATSDDCNDGDNNIHPGATEICDGVDNNCDGSIDEAGAVGAGTWYADADSDGYGNASSDTVSCSQPAGSVSDHTDCDDTNAAVNPAASEVCNSVDDDCDGQVDEGASDAATWHPDADSDGYGSSAVSVTSCRQPSGDVADGTDCDDAQASINPAAAEICNHFDDDCDGVVDEPDATDATVWYTDIDGDGYGDDATAVSSCTRPVGAVAKGGDCDDTDDATYPGAPEYCNGGDTNCDGVVIDVCNSCLAILEAGESTGDGVYNIDPDGSGADVDVYCDMTTDGGGWTLVQRTVWDWTESELLDTGYATWYGSTLGDASPGGAFRLAGEYWDDLNVDLDHMLVHVSRDAASGGDCDPLYYLGTDGQYTITDTSASLTGLSSGVYMTNSTELSTTDSGPSSYCPSGYDADPWFYSDCCTTCPTFKGGYWADEAHPMASYISDTADLNGNIDADVCPSGAAVSSSGYEGVNDMEYYLR